MLRNDKKIILQDVIDTLKSYRDQIESTCTDRLEKYREYYDKLQKDKDNLLFCSIVLCITCSIISSLLGYIIGYYDAIQ